MTSLGTPPRIFVHVGEPKTGTTFLQQIMFANKARLIEQGLLVPGPRPLAHWRAAQDLRRVPQPSDDPLGSNDGAWDRIAGQALSAPKTAVISHELLAAADAEQAERAVRSLEAGEVHIVATVRDFGSLLPAEWQETVKHRNAEGWDDWLTNVIDRESTAPDRRKFWFWRVHDTLAVLQAWSALVPPERVHVITVPHRGSDPDLLWHRFAAVVGVDPDVADTTAARSNASLGLAEVELLRRVNQALPEEIPNFAYMRNVKDTLAHGALASRPTQLARLELPEERQSWVYDHAAGVINGLRAAGYDIVGDLDELRPRGVSGSGAHPAQASADEMLDSAVIAIATLVEKLAEAQKGQRGAAAAARGPKPVGGSQPDAKRGPGDSRVLGRLRRALDGVRSHR